MAYNFKFDKHSITFKNVKLKRGSKKLLGDDIYFNITQSEWHLPMPSFNFFIVKEVMEEQFQDWFKTDKRIEVVDYQTNITHWDEDEYKAWNEWKAAHPDEARGWKKEKA